MFTPNSEKIVINGAHFFALLKKPPNFSGFFYLTMSVVLIPEDKQQDNLGRLYCLEMRPYTFSLLFSESQHYGLTRAKSQWGI